MICTRVIKVGGGAMRSLLDGSVRNSVFEALLRGYEPVLVNRSV